MSGRSIAFNALALVVAFATDARAQSEGPRAGSWAVEAASGPAASMIRFRGPSAAWVMGVNASFSHQVVQEIDPFTGVASEETQETLFTQVKLGLRRYSAGESRVRRYSTVSVLLGFDRNITGRGWRSGAAGELGAAYFFNAHASLGGAGELSAIHQSSTGSLAFGDRSIWTVQFSGFRLVGAVYF